MKSLDGGTGKDRTILLGIHAFYEPEELVGKTLIAITNLPPRAMMGIESNGMLLSAVNNIKGSEEEELHLLMVDNHKCERHFQSSRNTRLKVSFFYNTFATTTSVRLTHQNKMIHLPE